MLRLADETCTNVDGFVTPLIAILRATLCYTCNIRPDLSYERLVAINDPLRSARAEVVENGTNFEKCARRGGGKWDKLRKVRAPRWRKMGQDRDKPVKLGSLVKEL